MTKQSIPLGMRMNGGERSWSKTIEIRRHGVLMGAPRY